MERDVAYCYGIHSERYGAYYFACEKNRGSCQYDKHLDAHEALRKPSEGYLKRRGLFHDGARSNDDKLEMSKVAGRGGSDYRSCLDYTTRLVSGCVAFCIGKDADCLKICGSKGDVQACIRMEACSDPLSPMGRRL